MFLKQVWRHNKPLCLFFTVFIFCQLLVNYKGGMVFSPFYHFGMYSGKQYIIPVYNVPEAYKNGKIIEGKNYTTQQWDKIFVTYNYFTYADSNTNFNITEAERLGKKLGFSFNANRFKNSKVLFKLPGIDSVRTKNYNWNGKTLINE
jgi:hypothetical protein